MAIALSGDVAVFCLLQEEMVERNVPRDSRSHELSSVLHPYSSAVVVLKLHTIIELLLRVPSPPTACAPTSRLARLTALGRGFHPLRAEIQRIIDTAVVMLSMLMSVNRAFLVFELRRVPVLRRRYQPVTGLPLDLPPPPHPRCMDRWSAPIGTLAVL